jgi:acetolactate synthase-1/2/3 large subunit
VQTRGCRNAAAESWSSDMARMMSGAEILLEDLVDQGVEDIFGYPGGAVLPIYDELFKQNRVRHLLVRH